MPEDYRDYLADDHRPNRKRRSVPAVAIGLGLILGAAMAVAALAQDSHRWNPETHITLQPTSHPGAVAEVVFANQNIHTSILERFDLTMDGLTVTVLFERDVTQEADDRFTVTPPPGFIAVPDSLVVPENGAGLILIYEEAIG